MPLVRSLLTETDNLVEVQGIKDQSTRAWENAATVTMTLKDSLDATVSGADGVSLTYLTGSNGVYQGTLEDGLTLTVGDSYTLEIDVDAGSDKIRKIKVKMLAKEDIV